MNLISQLTFANPLALWALLSVPAVWLLLKIFPPAPKNIIFPPLNFLIGLNNEQETASKTPLWLLLFRILFVVLLILAFSKPSYLAKPIFNNSGPIILLIDNGWSASKNWENRKEKILEYISYAEQKKKLIILSLTAPINLGIENNMELLEASKARSIIETLVPQPWPSDYTEINKSLNSLDNSLKYNIIWFWDGLSHNSQESTQTLINSLEKIGSLTILDYFNNTPTKLIKDVVNLSSNELKVELIRNIGTIEEKVFVRANGQNGKLIARDETIFPKQKRDSSIIFKIPNDIKNNLTSISIENEISAGAVFLFDNKWKKRNVGIVGDKSAFRTQPLLSPAYYLDRAIKPYSEITIDELSILLDKNLSVIVMPGIGTIRQDLNEKLKNWMRNGGMLIRFAGPNLEGSNTDLLPVKLRSLDSRTFGGSLSWETPANIKTFPSSSPLFGIAIQEDILIRRQVIAQPSAELLNNTWATLEDGTPLITANMMDKGLNIFFHITANPDWSNMPLTGTFVEVLERIISLSEGTESENQNIPLKPYKLLDGFGRIIDPPNNALPLNFELKKELIKSRAPGYYGNELFRRVWNLSDHVNTFEPKTATFQEETKIEKYMTGNLFQLQPILLLLLIILIILDSIISLKIKGIMNLNSIKNIFKISIIFIIFANIYNTKELYAESKFSALETQLAYVLTDNNDLNEISYLGLLELTKVLRNRTSIEASEPKGIDIANDLIAFHPILYWPITSQEIELSETSINRIQNYMKNGGLIIFDTRDAIPSNIIANNQSIEQNILKSILKSLDLPILIKVPNDHVIKRSFYLLNDLPGRYVGESVWVEATARNSRDGVSSVVIGGNDWASSWAKDKNNQPLFSVVPGGEKQREFAYRFGVNLVMYAMTGNYKADQVHIKSILLRLNKIEENNEGN